ncbi:MAG: proteasome subunit beta [Candidatus Woesearchaeota archaeon]
MEQIKTGTTTLGLVCKDGAILAADNRATAGHFIARKDVEKVVAINDNIAVTTAGSVSDIQMFVKLFRAELKLKSIKTGRIVTVKEAANFAARICYDNARQYFPSMAHLIVAGFDNTGSKIYEVDIDGCMLDVKDYVSTGSGSILVYGILENSYKDNIGVKEGEELAVKAISSAIQRDSGSGNGIDVLVITKTGMKKSVTKKVSGNLI